ncbi:monocarboxylate transporter 13-like [Lineus longissimus]|uniref:monocarboxylate transporter 13-like n=1 Tax=Lineus longissimus TaxID=88925 RepID=UPI002B4CE7D0
MAAFTSQEVMETMSNGMMKADSTKSVKREAPASSTCPDGGWGWVVTASSFYSMFLVYGTVNCYGVIYIEWLDYFGESRTTTSMIGGLVLVSISIAGPVSSILANKFSHRAVVILGAIAGAVGMAMSAFANSIYFLYVSFGIIGGIGTGFATIASLSLVALYFDKKRATASTIAMSGGGIAYLVFPPVFDACIKAFTWRGTMLILGCFWLQCCVAGALLRPLPKKYISATAKRPPICDVGLLKKWYLWAYLLAELLWHVDLFNFPSILPDFARLNGHGKSESGLLLTIMGAVLIPSRILGGLLVDRFILNPLLSISLIVFVMGGSNLIFPFVASSYPALAVIAGLRGFLSGISAAASPGNLVLLFTTQRLTTAVGYNIMALGLGQLIAPPLGGGIHDRTGSYIYVYLTCAGLTFASGASYIFLYAKFRKRWKRNNTMNMEVTDEVAMPEEMEELQNHTRSKPEDECDNLKESCAEANGYEFKLGNENAPCSPSDKGDSDEKIKNSFDPLGSDKHEVNAV